MRPTPPTPEALIAFAAGDLAPAEAEPVARAVAADPALARRVALWRAAARGTAEDDSIAPPADVVARAKAVFRAAPAAAGSWWQELEAIVARVLFDSRLQPLALRAAETDRRIQLSFATPEAEVDLLLDAEGDDRWRLTGQVVADAPVAAPITVALLRSGATTPAFTIEADEAGGFTGSLPAGSWSLHLRLDDSRIVLEPITLP